MRQQQQRSRNRNRGRKSSNPLSRNFESNGPDVKIRGNASHIAEKYSVLARDALTSGDTVMAENYFQHAEHYFRIIAANQQQTAQRENGRIANNSGDEEEENDNLNSDTSESVRGDGPQPNTNGKGSEIILKGEKRAAKEKHIVAVNEVADDDVPSAASSVADGEESDQSEPVRKRREARREARRPANSRRTTRNSPRKKAESSAVAGELVDGLSKDAALLPSSLIGKTPEDDSGTAS